MSFDKLNKAELLRTLDEDFAFPLEENEKATKATILAAIAEGNLRFGDYLKANPNEAEKYKVEPAAPVTGANVLNELNSLDPETIGDETINVGTITVAEPEDVLANGVVVRNNVPVANSAPWLMKMERDNGLYEIGKYVFTKTHPFVLVDASDVTRVMREPGGGFRQATPDEAAAYYG